MTERQLLKALQGKFGNVTESSGGNGTEMIIDCPWCDHHKLSVNANKGVWQCWHCHESGTVSKLLGYRVTVEKPERKPKPKVRGYVSPGELIPLDELPEDHEAVLYVKNRKFDPKYLSQVFGLTYCRKGNSYGGGIFNTSGTIVIPVTMGGHEIAWQARLLYNPDSVKEGEEAAYGWLNEGGKWKKPPKYFTMPGLKKGEHFFNYDMASKCGFVVVTEGAFDAMRVGRCAVASFGKSLTDVQVDIIRNTWPLVVLLLDPDAESDQERLRRRIEGTGPFGGLSSGTRCVPVHLRGWKDAGEAPQEEVIRQIVQAAEAMGINLADYSKTNPF